MITPQNHTMISRNLWRLGGWCIKVHLDIYLDKLDLHGSVV